mgnify:CR=1 FL=1
MAKTKLFESWTFRLQLPPPFDDPKYSGAKPMGFSQYNTSSTAQKATLHAPTLRALLAYVKLVNSPYLKVYPDSGNLTNAAVAYHTRVSDDLETGRGSISAVHLKETKPGVFREVPYGTGHVDFVDVIKTAGAKACGCITQSFGCGPGKLAGYPAGKQRLSAG